MSSSNPMGGSCPVETSPEWLALLAEVGSRGKAMTAYMLNKNVIPSPTEGLKLLTDNNAEPTDERFNKSSDEFKLERTIDQQSILMTYRNRPNISAAQSAALDQIIKVNNDYKSFLERNIKLKKEDKPTIKTVSVSALIGSTEFSNPTDYENLKLFGIFMHGILEELQIERAFQNKKSRQIFNREFFDKKFTEYIRKTPFVIENLDADVMFDMAQEVVERLATPEYESHIILPEVTMTGIDRNGNMIVGRLDMLMIDTRGNVKIYDFKTKKVNDLITRGHEGIVIDEEGAKRTLATKMVPINNVRGAIHELQNGNRSVYDTWALQGKAYENMLRQAGMNVAAFKILGLLYQVDKEQVYKGHAVTIFDGNDFYYNAAIQSAVNSRGQAVHVETREKRIKGYRDLMDTVIPISEKEKKNSKKEATKGFPFDVSERENDELVRVLKKLIDVELKKIYGEIAEAKKAGNELLQATLETRRQTLGDFEKNISKNKDIWGGSMKMKFAFESIQNDILKFTETSDAAFKRYKEKSNEEDKNQEMVTVRESYQKLQQLKEAFDLIKQTIVQASRDPESKINGTSELLSNAERLSTLMETADANQRELSLKSSIEMMMKLGENTYRKVNEGVRQGLEPQLERKRKERELIANDMPVSWKEKFGKKLVTYFSKEYRDNASKNLNAVEKSKQERLEKIDMEIAKLEFMSKGLQYDPQSIENYLKAITQKDSIYYIGQSDAWGNSPFLSNFRPDQYMASASNSDPALVAITLFMKDAKAMSVANVQNDERLIAMESAQKKMLSKYNVEEMNKLITETRTVTDKDGNDYSHLSFVNPTSEAYQQKIRDFRYKTRAIAQEVSELLRQLHDKKTSAEREPIINQHREKVLEQEKLKNEYHQWAIDNMSLKFIKDFYEYQLFLPVEIREKTRNLYIERELIQSSVDNNSEEQLNELEIERLHMIEIEIKKIRQDASDNNEDYLKYLEMIENLFEYTPNYNFFNRIYNDKKIEHAENPALLDKWKRENVLLVPNADWYNARQEIYSQIEAIRGPKDKDIDEAFKERMKIMRNYRIGGQFDPTYISKEDSDKLMEIEDRIANLNALNKSQGGITLYDAAEKEMLDELYSQLKELQERRPSAFYEEEMDLRTDRLQNAKASVDRVKAQYTESLLKGDKEKSDQLASRLEYVEKQFAIKEADYEQWFNKNHVKPYISILSGGNPRIDAELRSFNFENTPPKELYDKYMEEKPHPKYSIRKLKESAYNPEYLEMPDGSPAPKGLVKINGVYTVQPGYETSQNINQKYLELLNNPDAFDFYNKSMDLFFHHQQRTQGRKLGYNVPGYQSTALENFRGMGMVGAAKKTFNTFVDEAFLKASEVDSMNNTYGDLGQKVRFRFNNQLGADIQTADAVNALKAWTVEAHHNYAMSEAQPAVENFIDYMETLEKDVKALADNEKGNQEFQKRFKDINNIIGIMKSERDKMIYGITEDASNKSLKKIVNSIFTYTSMIRIGFDVANQMKNYISGNIQAFMAAESSTHYTRADYMWAKSQMYGMDGFFSKYLSNWGKVTDADKEILMYRLYNPTQNDFVKYVDGTSGSNARRLASKLMSINELGFMLQDKGDAEIAMTVWLSIMKNAEFNKMVEDPATGKMVKMLDAQGREVKVSAYDAYEKNTKGQLVIRYDVNMTQEDENNLRNIVYSEMRRAQGNYAKSDMTKAERTLWGKMMFYFKKYLVPQMLNRLGYLRPDWEGQDVHLGYLRAMGTAWTSAGPMETMKHLLLGGFTPNLIRNNKLNALYTRKLGHASRELILGSVLLMLSMMAYGYVKRKNDDDEELDMVTGNLIRVLWGVKNETLSLNPIPVFGGADEYVRNFTNLTSLTREFQGAVKLFGHGIGLAYVKAMGGNEPEEDDSMLYHSAFRISVYQRKSGIYEEGDPKLTKDLHDLTGYKNLRDFFDPNYRIDLLKRNQ